MKELKQEILALFPDGDAPALTLKEVCRALGGRRVSHKVEEALQELTAAGYLARTEEGYCHLSRAGLAAGTFWSSGRGFGFVTPDGAQGRENDLFLPPRSTGQAWHGDRVLVELDRGRRRPGEGQSARVVAVLERGNPTVIGGLVREGRELWLRPDGGKLPSVKITGSHANLRPGDKAEVKILSYGGRTAEALGTVVRTFGRDGTRQAAVEAILARNAIPRTFPREVEEAAAKVSRQKDRADRVDLRGETVITIDGPDAKDLDDAISLTRTENGWQLGVHIADVSSFVKAGDALDQEAWRRGTSVYFADQVIPMLPEALSNGACSLNGGEERRTISCLMTVDGGGRVTDHRIVKGLIRSAARMNYPQCNALLAGEIPPDGGEELLPMLKEMETLAAILRKKRINRGALELESSECAVVCDEAGNPVDIRRRTTGVSEHIIEEFMLLANETVAEHLVRRGGPGVYRVHEKPTSAKLEGFQNMVAPFGYTLSTPDAFGMQKVLAAARGKPEEGAVSLMLLRSLMKARYAPENLGHFGLGAEFYCHFTSPIRRYPDLMVHRILTAELEGKLEGNGGKKLAVAAAEAASQSSQREVAAETAERDIEKCYMAEYMQGFLGEDFSGVVSGVTRFGVFVMLSNGVEGLLPISALPEDDYEYDEEHMTLTGRRRGQVYAFARPLEVRCLAADPGAGEVTFGLAGEETFVPAPPPPRKKEHVREKTARKKKPMHIPKRRRKRH